MATPRQSSRKTVTVRHVAGGRRFVKELHVPAYQTLAWVVNASGVVPLHAELAALQADGKLAYGVAGKVLPATHIPVDGDTVDVYVPVDPAALQRTRSFKAGNRLPDGAE